MSAATNASPVPPGAASDAARTAGSRERPAPAARVDLEELTRRVHALWLEDLCLELARRGGQP